MKILITGANGQLGNEMRVALASLPQLEGIYTDVDTLDICDLEALDAFVAQCCPDWIVNCAAYTAVDRAEDDQALCHKINCDAVRNLGRVAQKIGARMLHVSTDYVFDGTGFQPYTEDMPVAPKTVYGITKLAGEKALFEVCEQSVVVRTAWLYSSFGNNFVKTMLRLGRERNDLGVVFDQVGTPTYAADLAQAIVSIVLAEKFVPGIYHFTNEGVCSWYDFTDMIFRLAHIDCQLRPIESKEYAYRTPRPHYSVLNKSKIKQTYGIAIPHWIDGLQRCLQILEEK